MAVSGAGMRRDTFIERGYMEKEQFEKALEELEYHFHKGECQRHGGKNGRSDDVQGQVQSLWQK